MAYAYLIIESTAEVVKIGDITIDETVKDQDYTWKVFNFKKGSEKYFRGLRLCKYPKNEEEGKKLMNLIYKAMENVMNRSDERQRCVEELKNIDGKTEYENLMFMEHILERIRKREEARAKLSGGSKELPPREMIWEGINYYKEQAIAKLSEEVD